MAENTAVLIALLFFSAMRAFDPVSAGHEFCNSLKNDTNHLMKTDVHEHDDHYEVDIDLPGFKKDEITLDLENGYLTVGASKSLDEDHKNLKGKLIRQERYAGSMQRSFYVGEYITEEDISAKFEDGVLRLSVPKKEAPKLPEKKTIRID